MLLVPQRKKGYLCFVACVETPQQLFSRVFGVATYYVDFGDGLFPLDKILPYTCVLLDSPMLSFCVRSCSLLEAEHSRLTP